MKDNLCFIDTNIWLYTLLDPQNNQDKKKSILADRLLDTWYSKICISSQVINEVLNNMSSKYKTSFTDKDREAIMQYFYHANAIFSVIDINESVIKKALHLRTQYPKVFNYWDSIIVATALESECNLLFSEDMHNGFMIENRLKIINPFV